MGNHVLHLHAALTSASGPISMLRKICAKTLTARAALHHSSITCVTLKCLISPHAQHSGRLHATQPATTCGTLLCRGAALTATAILSLIDLQRPNAVYLKKRLLVVQLVATNGIPLCRGAVLT